MNTPTVAALRGTIKQARSVAELNPLLPQLHDVLARDTDRPLDLAQVIYEAQVVAGGDFQRLDAATEQIVLGWVRKHWSNEPLALFELLSAILVNLAGEAAGQLLEEKLATEPNPRRQEQLRASIRDRAGDPEEPDPGY